MLQDESGLPLWAANISVNVQELPDISGLSDDLKLLFVNKITKKKGIETLLKSIYNLESSKLLKVKGDCHKYCCEKILL